MTGSPVTTRPAWQRPLLAAGILIALAIPLVSMVLPVLVSPPVGPSGDRARVTMLTSLPIGLAGSASLAATLDADTVPDPLMARLAERVDIAPVDALDAATLAETDTLLLAHPRALPPETFVLIDGWVRDGGTVVVLADGLSSWHGIHPLGDPRNAPVTSLLTPLLTRWGLSLDAPPGMVPSPTDLSIAGYPVRFVSPGRLTVRQGGCQLDSLGIIGDCPIGKGHALVVSDADFLDPALWAGQGAEPSRPGNVAWLLDILGDVRYSFRMEIVREPTR